MNGKQQTTSARNQEEKKLKKTKKKIEKNGAGSDIDTNALCENIHIRLYIIYEVGSAVLYCSAIHTPS